ncbi:MAG TPA: WYL domain-containing protein [Thermomicrobiales bacterium]|jgi:predicted DNA-binding transcriptional regulator YafY
MNRFDRALALLLLLRGGKTFSASDLARRFEVSPRTIYRDVETLSAVGVPVYAEMGRAGGFRLLAGYFLPPVMLTSAEAISLLLGLTLLRSLRATPFAADLETAEQKLLAAVPDYLRATLADARNVIGFEQPPADLFHPDPPDSAPPVSTPETEGMVVSIFLQAVLDRRTLLLRYRSPYGATTDELTAVPLGLFWDRDRWYLAGRRDGASDELRLWRADRVLAIAAQTSSTDAAPGFDVRDLLGRTWLHAAMEQWRAESPVTIRLSRRQAARLQQDWYYRHARYEPLPNDDVLMIYGDTDRAVVLELLRWLGPEAELIEPKAWRADARAELARMLARYDDPPYA